MLILALLLVAGSLWIYAPALTGGFIWDDDVHFTANDVVRRWKGLIDIWTTRSAVYYPLVLTTAWGLHKVVGFNPQVFHAVTLALHIANAWLLMLVLRRWGLRGAWLAGLLFAWHPLQVESVAWVTELKNTQSAFFLFASVWALQQSGFFSSPKPASVAARRWHRLSIFLYVLAVLSKPSVVAAPVVLMLVVWWKRGVRRWWDVDGLFPHLITAILAAGWTIWEQRYSSGAQGFEWATGMLDRLALSGQVFWFYVQTLWWPHPVMFLYPQWEVAPDRLLAWLPLLGAVGAGGLFWWKRASWGLAPGLVLCIYAAFLFPVMGFFNVYFMRYAWVADHFMYLPAIPWFAAAGAAWARLRDRWSGTAWAVAAVVLVVCGVLSHRHARTFHDMETLWRSALAANPAAWMAHNNLGLHLRDRGDIAGARHHYEEALRHNPRHYEAMNNLGLLLADEGRTDEALAMFDRALELRPDLYMAWLNRGNLLRDTGRTDDAFASYRKAAEVNPKFDAAWANAAVLAESAGDGSKAAEFYRDGLRRKKLSDQDIGGFLYERALIASQHGRNDLALSLLDEAEPLFPHLADIHLLRGHLLEKHRSYVAAEKSYRKALHFRPDWAAVVFQLARLLATHPDDARRQPVEAAAMLEDIMRSGGDTMAEVVDVYAMALAAAGRWGEAIQTQQRAIRLEKDAGKQAEMERRMRGYERGEAYRLPAGEPAGDAAHE